ncbi:hypothetical protein ERO13_A02G056801v2, partial [Gossypium hirsutum]
NIKIQCCNSYPKLFSKVLIVGMHCWHTEECGVSLMVLEISVTRRVTCEAHAPPQRLRSNVMRRHMWHRLVTRFWIRRRLLVPIQS